MHGSDFCGIRRQGTSGMAQALFLRLRIAVTRKWVSVGACLHAGTDLFHEVIPGSHRGISGWVFGRPARRRAFDDRVVIWAGEEHDRYSTGGASSLSTARSISSRPATHFTFHRISHTPTGILARHACGQSGSIRRRHSDDDAAGTVISYRLLLLAETVQAAATPMRALLK